MLCRELQGRRRNSESQGSRGAFVLGFVDFTLDLRFYQVAFGLLPLRLGVEKVGQGDHGGRVAVPHHAQVLGRLLLALLGCTDKPMAVLHVADGLLDLYGEQADVFL